MTTQPAKYNEIAKTYTRLAGVLARASKKEREARAALKEFEEEIRCAILEDKLDRVTVRGVNFTPSERDIAEMYDSAAFFEYVRKNNAFDLVHQRVTMEAARERWNAGKTIPGIRPGKVPTLSVTKARATKLSKR